MRHQSWNFYKPHWDLICLNKWHPGTSKKSAPNSCRGTFMGNIALKQPLVYLPADGDISWLLLSGGTMQPENTYSCILEVTDQFWDSQKRISINTNYIYHQCPFP